MINKKPFITAHRGASGLAPENTMASILLALKLGADFSEIDVQETADGKIIVLHDSNLSRTTNQKGKIWKLSFADIQNTDAGSWFSPDFSGEKIPTLESVVDLVIGKMKLNIELKTNGHHIKLAERVVEIIERKNIFDQCVVTSFDLEEVKKVKLLNPKIKTGLIFSKIPQNDIWNSEFDLFSIDKKLATKEFIQKTHEAGKEVHVWTVNKEKKMRKLIELGVDNIITNIPNVLIKILNEKM
jgi:glycerophosphoryl diester phosphodiesterase